MKKYKKYLLVLGLVAMLNVGSLNSQVLAQAIEGNQATQMKSLEVDLIKNIENIVGTPEIDGDDSCDYIVYTMKDKENNENYDTLWHYDIGDEKNSLIAKSQNISFIKNHKSGLNYGELAVLETYSTEDEKVKNQKAIVKILDSNQNVLFTQNLLTSELKSKLDWKETSYIDFTLNGWSEDGRYVWIETGLEYAWIRLDLEEKTAKYIAQDYQSRDSVFNINTGWLCESDYPVMYDANDSDKFVNNETKVNLKLRNIFTSQTIKLDSKVAKRFYPKWIDNNTLLYKDKNENWVVYTLEDSKVDSDK